MTSQVLRLTGAGGAPDGEIEIPDEGGLVVLEGHNGSGKSQTLDAITDLTTGERNIKLKHGRSKGEVSGFGATIRLGARTSRKGELEVVGLTSRMDVAAIVDPGYKGRDQCNRAIVKSLVRMLGLTPEVALFYDLCATRKPGESDEELATRKRAIFDELMPAGLGDCEDLVELARKVKDAFDGAARRIKGESERVQGEADALLATGSDLDLEAPHAADALQAALEQAIAADGGVRERVGTFAEIAQAAADARAKVGEGGGPDADAMNEAHEGLSSAAKVSDEAGELVTSLVDEVTRAQAALEQASSAHARAQAHKAAANDRFHAAEQRLMDLEAIENGWEAAQKAIAVLADAKPPTGDEVGQAAAAVAQARKDNDRGTLVRNALEKRAHGKQRRRDAATLRGREDELREAGRSTDAILSRLINEAGVEGFSVVDGEVLAVPPGESQPRPYLDLSDGQRTRIACDATIPVALRDVPADELAVIVLGQRVYQDLDPTNRRALVEHVKGRRVLLFSALPTDGPMRAVVADTETGAGITA